MLSRLSAHTRRMTSCESMPSDCDTRPISFANVILSAWNALQLILSASATRMFVTRNRPVEMLEHALAPRSTAASQLPPTIVYGG